jgi:alkanesulfonate monooxygenase SsuD/methylene tetrahydromethanopterin reductase-like flavin-dependent oxidoreductase (luciferase family)
MTTGSLLLGVEADGAGAHPAAWRYPGISGTALDPRFINETVTAAERAGFAFAAFGDGPVPPPAGTRIEAGVRAAYLSQLTKRIGLAPTLHVTTTEPFHLATQLASLDHASHGRAAWVLGAANDGPARRLSARPRSTTPLEARRSGTSSTWREPCGTPGRTTRSSRTW